MTKRVYVSGPMSGRVDLNRAAFEAAAEALRERGHEPVIPHPIEPAAHPDRPCVGRPIDGKDHGYGCYLLADLATLAGCGAYTLLPDWDDSPGSRAEMAFAEAVGIPELDLTCGDCGGDGIESYCGQWTTPEDGCDGTEWCITHTPEGHDSGMACRTCDGTGEVR
jgi:hypothetical protein